MPASSRGRVVQGKTTRGLVSQRKRADTAKPKILTVLPAAKMRSPQSWGERGRPWPLSLVVVNEKPKAGGTVFFQRTAYFPA